MGLLQLLLAARGVKVAFEVKLCAANLKLNLCSVFMI